jgi:hypothetical protein
MLRRSVTLKRYAPHPTTIGRQNPATMVGRSGGRARALVSDLAAPATASDLAAPTTVSAMRDDEREEVSMRDARATMSGPTRTPW